MEENRKYLKILFSRIFVTNMMPPKHKWRWRGDPCWWTNPCLGKGEGSDGDEDDL